MSRFVPDVQKTSVANRNPSQLLTMLVTQMDKVELRPHAASHCRRHPAAWGSLTFSAVCPLELRFAQDSNICRKDVTDGGGPLRYSFLVNA
jgi:hypothetical protein